MLLLSFIIGIATTASLLTQLSFATPLQFFRRGPRATGSLSSFIASESPIALQGVLNNVGAAGPKATGADPGLVVASPSKTDPDCKF